MKKALVAGGAGFIGSHLCERLLGDDWQVFCIDNLITGSLKNVEHLKGSEKFFFIRADITQPLPKEIAGEKFNTVLHLASPASPQDYMRWPLETILANTQGTQNLLNLCKGAGASFLFTSTSEVYGDPQVHPQPETYWGNVNPVGPRSPYDESKRLGETYAMLYHRNEGVNARIVRIFNTYGPKMQRGDGRAIPTFISQALLNEDITVYGDGSQTRSFCYVADLVEGITKAVTLPATRGKVINLGNTEEFTIAELAQLIKKATGSKSRLVYKPLPEDDPTRRRPDISLAKRLLGWEPKVSLEEGLVQTIEYFKTLL
ncbi:MAG: SDR family oxidoreductase [Candidatus Blackburnbacteria bacterium]|nr:SDR family oxidoreductase [Candidatus Blackburnbacteria bacterium]